MRVHPLPLFLVLSLNANAEVKDITLHQTLTSKVQFQNTRSWHFNSPANSEQTLEKNLKLIEYRSTTESGYIETLERLSETTTSHQRGKKIPFTMWLNQNKSCMAKSLIVKTKDEAETDSFDFKQNLFWNLHTITIKQIPQNTASNLEGTIPSLISFRLELMDKSAPVTLWITCLGNIKTREFIEMIQGLGFSNFKIPDLTESALKTKPSATQ